MNAKKILIGSSTFGETDTSPIELLSKSGFVIVDNPYKRRMTKEELLQNLNEEIVGVIAGLEPYDREVMVASKLKVISRVGSGLSNVDLEVASELRIKVCSTPQAPVEAVAELTIGALLSLLRMIPKMDYSLHEGKWEKTIGVELKGKTIAVIGYGRIGERVAELLSPFGVRIVIVDPFIDDNRPIAYEKIELEEALAEADVVSIHASGERTILGDREFELMKKDVFILNVARGAMVSETALVDGLRSGKVAGAWIDAHSNEPYSGQLCGFDNVVLTPHVGSYTRECRSQMETEAAQNLIDALKTI